STDSSRLESDVNGRIAALSEPDQVWDDSAAGSSMFAAAKYISAVRNLRFDTRLPQPAPWSKPFGLLPRGRYRPILIEACRGQGLSYEYRRRDVLRQSGQGALGEPVPWGGRPACPRGLGGARGRRRSRRRIERMGAMDEIRHIVVLMLENQSFDRLLGYLDLADPAQKVEGLTGAESNPVSPPGDMTPVP